MPSSLAKGLIGEAQDDRPALRPRISIDQAVQGANEASRENNSNVDCIEIQATVLWIYGDDNRFHTPVNFEDVDAVEADPTIDAAWDPQGGELNQADVPAFVMANPKFDWPTAWSVYVHLEGVGVHHIEDFKREAEADAFAAELAKRFGVDVNKV